MSKIDVYEVTMEAEDPFYNPVQKGQINVKCSKELEDAIRSAAEQLGKKPSDLVRSIMKQALIGLALKDKIVLSQVPKSPKKVSGL